MFVSLSPSLMEAVHNLINLHLLPDCALRAGQCDRAIFCDVEIVWQRVGNVWSSGRDAITYKYFIDGPGFSLYLVAIWPDPNQATADVHVGAVTPDNDDAREALEGWLASVFNARVPPRDLFGHLGLQ